MFFPRALIIAAEPRLRATLVEQFAALGRYALRDDPLGAPGEDWPDAAIVDEAHCDPKALADARAQGCRTRVVLIADRPKSPPQGVDAVVTRPIRFAEWSRSRFHTGMTVIAFRDRRTGRCSARAEADRKETAILARLARAHGAAVRARLCCATCGLRSVCRPAARNAFTV
jgi:hypothetical protein